MIVAFIISGLFLMSEFSAAYTANASFNFSKNIKISLQNLDKPEAYAIIIGVNDYPGTNEDLESSVNDMNSIRHILVNEMGYLPQNIYSLFNITATSQKLGQIFKKLTQIMNPDDSLFFYFSGHGDYGKVISPEVTRTIESFHPYSSNVDEIFSLIVPGVDGIRIHFSKIDVEKGYDAIWVGDQNLTTNSQYVYDSYSGSYTDVWSPWIHSNTVHVELYSDGSEQGYGFKIDKYQTMNYNHSARLVTYDTLQNSNELWGSQLNSYYDQLPSQKIYTIVDSCYSGGLIYDLNKTGRMVMTSSQFNELSIEDEEFGHGLFTHYFLKAFARNSTGNGEYLNADYNHDNVLTWNEVYNYVDNQTIEQSTKLDSPQHPAYLNRIEGEDALRPTLQKINSTGFISGNFNVYFSVQGTNFIESINSKILLSNQNIINAHCLPQNNKAAYEYPFGIYELSYDPVSQNYVTAYVIDVLFANGMKLYLFDSNNTKDTDSDHIPDVIEHIIGTASGNYSLDGFTAKNSSDTDNDGLSDYAELTVYGTNPLLNDTDGDGLNDSFEIITYGTSPFITDCDNDGLSDYAESIYGTNPYESDTDQDGYSDSQEITKGSNPLNINESPATLLRDKLSLFSPVLAMIIITVIYLFIFKKQIFTSTNTRYFKKKYHIYPSGRLSDVKNIQNDWNNNDTIVNDAILNSSKNSNLNNNKSHNNNKKFCIICGSKLVQEDGVLRCSKCGKLSQ